MKNSGIYQIINTVNGKRYVGSSLDLHRRWNKHKNEARKGIHHSAHLQAAWRKYGVDAFTFSVIENCGRDMILSREQYFVDTLSPEYNIARVVKAPMTGRKQTAAAKALISAANRGSIRTPEQCAQMSASHKGTIRNVGRKATAAQNKRNSEVRKGRKLPPEHCANIGRSQVGRKKSAAECAAISERNRGNTNCLGLKYSLERLAARVAAMTQVHEYKGVSHTSAEWGKIFDISDKGFACRLRMHKGDPDKIFVPRMKARY
jgi:group I intron endonuclease